MSSSLSTICLTCGREDRVSGREDTQTGDVELCCRRCGTSWWRGGRRCATCRGQEWTGRLQVMRRHSRGTQLSIVGWRDAVLCPRCDEAVIESVGDAHTPIPEDYVSAAIVDRHAPKPLRAPAAPAAKAAGTGRPGTATVPSSRQAASPPQPAPSQTSTLATQPAAPTTVRQALQQAHEQLATNGIALDPTVVLLLGTRLGLATRLQGPRRFIPSSFWPTTGSPTGGPPPIWPPRCGRRRMHESDPRH